MLLILLSVFRYVGSGLLSFLKVAWPYLVSAAIGACAWQHFFAGPKEINLQTQISVAAAAAVRELNDFKVQAAKDVQAKQDALDKATKEKQTNDQLVKVAKAKSDASDKRLRDYIARQTRPSTNNGANVPAGQGAGGSDAPYAWGVVQRFDDFAGQCTAEVERLGGELRFLTGACGSGCTLKEAK